jgi:hypothetical protein
VWGARGTAGQEPPVKRRVTGNKHTQHNTTQHKTTQHNKHVTDIRGADAARVEALPGAHQALGSRGAAQQLLRQAGRRGHEEAAEGRQRAADLAGGQ